MRPDNLHWHSSIQAPMVLDNANGITWDEETEMVVVGAGAAGTSAALEAAERNTSVMLLDRFTGGGASALSGGIVYLGGGTWCQEEAGFEDSAEEMFKYLQMEVKGVVKDETLRRFCDTSVDTLRWLESQGVEFSASLSPVKTSYPTNKYFLYYSGNEIVKEFSDQARPAPRGHRVKWNGFSGEGLMQALLASCERHERIAIRYQSKVRRLIVDRNGEVLGLELLQVVPRSAAARKHQGYYCLFKQARNLLPPLAGLMQKLMSAIEIDERLVSVRRVRAHKGTVLAAGGFIFNREMARYHTPVYAQGMPLGSPGCDGSGIRLGESTGAATGLMEKGSAWRFINPPQAFVQGVIVSPDGERFVNELSYGARIGEYLVEHYGGKGTLIVNREIIKKALPQLMPGRAWFFFQSALIFLTLLFSTKKAATIEQLAQKSEIPVENLCATLGHYNEAIAQGEEDPMGKPDEFRHSLANGPYYAIDISVGNPIFKCATLTFGGLLVDEESGQISRKDGGVFKNLYAAGRTAVGLSSRSYVSGLSLADCVFSGRRAGAHIADKR